jgi:hypothetical protein
MGSFSSMIQSPTFSPALVRSHSSASSSSSSSSAPAGGYGSGAQAFFEFARQVAPGPPGGEPNPYNASPYSSPSPSSSEQPEQPAVHQFHQHLLSLAGSEEQAALLVQQYLNSPFGKKIVPEQGHGSMH